MSFFREFASMLSLGDTLFGSQVARYVLYYQGSRAHDDLIMCSCRGSWAAYGGVACADFTDAGSGVAQPRHTWACARVEFASTQVNFRAVISLHVPCHSCHCWSHSTAVLLLLRRRELIQLNPPVEVVVVYESSSLYLKIVQCKVRKCYESPSWY